MQDFLRFKDSMLVQQYVSYLYISPNLDTTAAHLAHENAFLSKMEQLASPVPIHYMGTLPTVEEILTFVPPGGGRICLFLDDFQVSIIDVMHTATLI